MSVDSDKDKVCLFPLHEILTVKEAATWLGISVRRLWLLLILGGGPRNFQWHGGRIYLRKSDVDQYAKSLFAHVDLPQQYYVSFRKSRNETTANQQHHPLIDMITRDELHRVAVTSSGKIIVLLGLVTIMFSHSPWLHDFF